MVEIGGKKSCREENEKRFGKEERRKIGKEVGKKSGG